MSHLSGRGLWLVAGACLLAGGAHAQAGATQAAGECHPASVREPIMVAPSAIKWGSPPPALPPGAQFALLEGDPNATGSIVSFRLKVPAGYRIAPHFHVADEHVVVLSGAVRMGMGEKMELAKSSEMKAGGFVVVPAKKPHFISVTEDAVLHVYAIAPWTITYVNPADDPRNQKK